MLSPASGEGMNVDNRACRAARWKVTLFDSAEKSRPPTLQRAAATLVTTCACAEALSSADSARRQAPAARKRRSAGVIGRELSRRSTKLLRKSVNRRPEDQRLRGAGTEGGDRAADHTARIAARACARRGAVRAANLDAIGAVVGHLGRKRVADRDAGGCHAAAIGDRNAVLHRRARNGGARPVVAGNHG